MKVILIVIGLILVVIGINILDDIEGDEATTLGFACVVGGIFLGIMGLMFMPPL